MTLDVNNTNFPNGLPVDLSQYRIRESDSNKIGNRRNGNRFSEFIDYTMVNSRNKTRFIPKRNYDITEIPIQNENAWDQILSSNLDAQSSSSIAAYPQKWTDVGFNVNNRNATNRYSYW
jgi:hypothetical protein